MYNTDHELTWNAATNSLSLSKSFRMGVSPPRNGQWYNTIESKEINYYTQDKAKFAVHSIIAYRLRIGSKI